MSSKSQFELIREKNIARNETFLKQIGLSGVKKELQDNAAKISNEAQDSRFKRETQLKQKPIENKTTSTTRRSMRQRVSRTNINESPSKKDSDNDNGFTCISLSIVSMNIIVYIWCRTLDACKKKKSG